MIDTVIAARQLTKDFGSGPVLRDKLAVKAGIEADVDPANEDEVRAARRAYYANTSYFDSKVGEVVKALEELVPVEGAKPSDFEE